MGLHLYDHQDTMHCPTRPCKKMTTASVFDHFDTLSLSLSLSLTLSQGLLLFQQCSIGSKSHAFKEQESMCCGLGKFNRMEPGIMTTISTYVL